VITRSSPGDTVTSADLADAVAELFPASYGGGTLAKIGRNTFSSWEQTGHLGDAVRPAKVRVRAACRPADIAYALLLGHVEGARGHALFETLWARVLDQPKSHLLDLAATASQHGMLELRSPPRKPSTTYLVVDGELRAKSQQRKILRFRLEHDI
jgi:hypothetical protein